MTSGTQRLLLSVPSTAWVDLIVLLRVSSVGVCVYVCVSACACTSARIGAPVFVCMCVPVRVCVCTSFEVSVITWRLNLGQINTVTGAAESPHHGGSRTLPPVTAH